MTANTAYVPPLSVLCPMEGLRLRLSLDRELVGVLVDGDQLVTIRRFQRYGLSAAHGDYLEGIAAVSATSGLILGVHRRVYVQWISPALDPAFNYSRYYCTVLALPMAMSPDYALMMPEVTLLQTERFAKAVQDL